MTNDQSPPKRSDRRATRLQDFTIRLASNERTSLTVDVYTSKAIGPYANNFSTYLGVVI